MNAEMRKNTRPYVEEKFGWKSVAQSVAGVYEELLQENEVDPETTS
jgi:hypothetical protein